MMMMMNSRMPQNASLVPLISEPIRVNVLSFVIHKRGNSQYPEQAPKGPLTSNYVIDIGTRDYSPPSSKGRIHLRYTTAPDVNVIDDCA